jgi:hypothetical protein
MYQNYHYFLLLNHPEYIFRVYVPQQIRQNRHYIQRRHRHRHQY